MSTRKKVISMGLMLGFGVASSVLLVGCTKKESSYLEKEEISILPRNSSAPEVSSETLTKQEGLKKLLEVMAYYAHPSQNLENLYSFLLDSSQMPKVYGDTNELIGDNYFIRTEAPPLGTRYFQALYEEHPDGLIVRHMSFEYEKSKEALREVLEEVSRIFPLAKRDLDFDESSGFIVWDLLDGYTLSVKQLDEFDINEGHPINAYSEEDIGVIRIAIELDPH